MTESLLNLLGILLFSDVLIAGSPQPFSRNAFLFTDSMVKLSGLSTIEGRSLILRQGILTLLNVPVQLNNCYWEPVVMITITG